jgi:biopolymer transport protein ExbD
MAGLLDKKRDREEIQVPLAGMADIAFLLLIFFLVVTTIDMDTGIGMTLPPKLDEDQEPPPVRQRNVMNLLLNAQGQLLMNDELANVSQVREQVVRHVTNFGEDPNLSERPGVAVVSIKTDRNTRYDRYIDVLDEVWMAYFAIWDNAVRSGEYTGGRTYRDYDQYRNQLGEDEENEIREVFPAQISVAEPDQG